MKDNYNFTKTPKRVYMAGDCTNKAINRITDMFVEADTELIVRFNKVQNFCMLDCYDREKSKLHNILSRLWLLVTKCDTIYMIEGWYKDNDARRELKIARLFGKREIHSVGLVGRKDM